MGLYWKRATNQGALWLAPLGGLASWILMEMRSAQTRSGRRNWSGFWRAFAGMLLGSARCRD